MLLTIAIVLALAIQGAPAQENRPDKSPEKNPFAVTMLFSVYSICQFIGAPILGAISEPPQNCRWCASWP